MRIRAAGVAPDAVRSRGRHSLVRRIAALGSSAVLGTTTLLAGSAPATGAPTDARPDVVRIAMEAPGGAQTPGGPQRNTPAGTEGPEPAAGAEETRTGDGEETGALEVTIETLTPSTMPRRGRVTVTGELTNHTTQTWQNLQASLVVSPEPIRSRAALADAVASDPDLVIGQRLLRDGQYVNLGDLAPGESVPYRLSLPRRDLPISGAAGVYWLSVHVLGTDEQGNRDDVADARTRTFLPLVPPAGRGPGRARTPVRAALVVPVRQQVLRRAGGPVGETGTWDELLADDGRLGRLLEFAESTATDPLTWLIDPSVLDGVARLGAGNPGFDTGPSSENPSGGTGGPEPTASATPDDDGTVTPDRPGDPDVDRRAALAGDWLDRLRDALANTTVLALPYADPDLAAAWRHGHLDLVEDAVAQSAITLSDLGFAAAPIAIAPAGGLLPSPALEPVGDLIAEIAGNATLLLSDQAVRDTASTTLSAAGHRIVLSDSAASGGGPAPADPYAALAVRQQVLAEAALRVDGVGADQGSLNQDGGDQDGRPASAGPLVVQLPDTWDPGAGDPQDFIDGLDVEWLDLTNLRAATTDRARDEVYDDGLNYPRSARRVELPARNFETAAEIRDAGRALSSLLLLNDTVDTEVDRAALSVASAQARYLPSTPVSLGRATMASIRNLLSGVRIESPEFVTMSSGEGHFAVTVVNDLDEPIRVAVVPTTDDEDELTITAPAPLELAGGARVSLRLGARSSGFGVSEVQLTPATSDGTVLPRTSTINVRRSQVGIVIWVVMGLGAAVLVVALVVRVVRRRRPATDDTTDDTTGDPTDTPPGSQP